MKFSKESHRKAGVNNNQMGFFYKDPKNGKDEPIEVVVKNRVAKTKSLYNLFGTTGGKAVSKKAKAVANAVNGSIRSLRKENQINELNVKTFVNSLIKETNEEYVVEDIDNALDTLLKASFRVQKTKEALRILLISSLVNKNELTKEESDQIQEYFIKKLVEDYNKTRIINYIPKAIKNQNMVIQPDESKANLVVSGGEKKPEKRVLREFLAEYATLDEKKRKELRLGIRRLIDCYFYGIDAVIREDFDEWEDHIEKRQKEEKFVEQIKKGEKFDADATAAAIRNKNIDRYRNTTKLVEENSEVFLEENLSKFWIHHIESEVERIYTHIGRSHEDYRFTLGYLSEKVWKGIINFLSVKYIAEGKAVYNYAMGALNKESESREYGKLEEAVKAGISSFEYERIKAEETLQRECAVYVAFAANHLAHATVKLDENNTDFLLLKNKELDEKAKERGQKSLAELVKNNALRNILQFFGGQSAWKEFDFRDEIEFLNILKDMIYSLRNTSFHFKTLNKDSGMRDSDLIFRMFEKECSKVATIQKDKMYSNNLPMFYKSDYIERVLNKLYAEYNERASQVPAFNAVFVRKNFAEYLKDNKMTPAFSEEDLKKWQSAVYYLYKEIYYNGFLQDKNALSYFKSYVKSLDDCDKNNGKANKDFKEAFNIYNKGDLSSLCQNLMTEYNNQNKGQRVKISGRTNKDEQLIYKHYKMILLAGLKKAFSEYIKENADIFGFITKPIMQQNVPAVENFLSDYKSNMYEALLKSFKDDSNMQKWYIVGRLLNPKQVNQLVGSFRSYKQYVNDIVRRAKLNGITLTKQQLSIDVDKIVEVLDICTKLNGITSNNVTDYFDNDDEYARFLNQFIDYNMDESEPYQSLKNWDTYNLYSDDKNPIVNRNVIQCKLYGATDVLTGILTNSGRRVTVETINAYKEKTSAIAAYKNNGKCSNKDEQKELCDYQELKNRVELRNLVEYSEIINELQGQLINWGYLRERDLMYLQLGFHYLCLKNNNKEKSEGYDTAGDIKGLILYQIVALYTNGLPLMNGKGESKENGAISTGSKIGSFISYSGEIIEKKEAIYLAGLELFENVKEHDKCTKLRDYIDHFHYYSKKDRSMLDIYSEVFDRFFSYDMKYAKNVPNMLYNILLRHMVVPEFEFGSGKKEMDNGAEKGRATIGLKSKNGLSSELFTYTELGKCKLPARNNEYLKDIVAILYYPKVPDDDIIRDRNTDIDKAKTEKKKNFKGNKKENRFKDNSRKPDNGKLKSNPFAGIKL